MKKQLVIMVTCVLFLTLCLSGCEQFFSKSDLVNVNVMVAVFINAVDENYNPINISFTGAVVTIELLKNGNRRVMLKRIVQNNLCQASDNLDLIQGDSIECVVNVPNGYGNFHPVANGSAILTWETAYANMNYGGLYNWYPHITIMMKQGSVK
jgi:hypothetical protein